MSETIKQFIYKVALPVLVPLVVTVVTALVSTHGLVNQLDVKVQALEAATDQQRPLSGRVDNLEDVINRHEKALAKDFARHETTMTDISHKTDDQEKRLTRLETLVNETQNLLSEIRADVKALLRGHQQ